MFMPYVTYLKCITKFVTEYLKRSLIKGIAQLNIIFLYMKVNKICNLDHPVY